MKFFERDDWKNYLTEENKEVLRELLNVTKKYKGAYFQANEPRIAQLWSALIEIKKELNQLKGVEEPIKEIIPIEEKNVIEKLVSEVTKPAEEDTVEATKKLVDSLMKF